MSQEIKFPSENQVLTNDMKFLIKELYETVFGVTETKINPTAPKPEPAINPYKGLNKSTINFLNALKKEFRGEEILFSNETFQKLRFENRVVNLTNFIDSLSERGLIQCVDNKEGGKRRRFISFHINP